MLKQHMKCNYLFYINCIILCGITLFLFYWILLLNPVVHSKSLHSQFVQVSGLQIKRFLEYSTKHTKEPFWNVKLVYQYSVTIHLERATAFTFRIIIEDPFSSLVIKQWITLLYYAVEAMSCIWWIG